MRWQQGEGVSAVTLRALAGRCLLSPCPVGQEGIHCSQVTKMQLYSVGAEATFLGTPLLCPVQSLAQRQEPRGLGHFLDSSRSKLGVGLASYRLCPCQLAAVLGVNRW